MTPKQTEAVMQLLVTMMIFDRSKRDNCPAEELLRKFRRSRTYEMLFDKDTGMWMNGPDYISDEYDLELKNSGLI